MPDSGQVAEKSVAPEKAEHIRFPGVILAGTAFVLGLSMIAAFVARTTDIGATRLSVAPAAQSRDLRFVDLPNAKVSVVDAVTNREIKILTPDSHGFIKIVLKDLAQQRAMLGIGQEPPFRLSRLTDDTIILTDTATGRIITLNAFGNSNALAFKPLLDAGKE
jgi:putative photosynthetic complex assembly protein